MADDDDIRVEAVSKFVVALQGDRYVDPQELEDRIEQSFQHEMSVSVTDYDDHGRRRMR